MTPLYKEYALEEIDNLNSTIRDALLAFDGYARNPYSDTAQSYRESVQQRLADLEEISKDIQTNPDLVDNPEKRAQQKAVLDACIERFKRML